MEILAQKNVRETKLLFELTASIQGPLYKRQQDQWTNLSINSFLIHGFHQSQIFIKQQP